MDKSDIKYRKAAYSSLFLFVYLMTIFTGSAFGNDVVYFTASTGYNEGRLGDVSWSESSYGLFAFIPETGAIKQLTREYSPDYAQNWADPYTVDGRLLYLRGFGESSGEYDQLDIFEFDTVSLEYIIDRRILSEDIRPDRFTIAGNNAYYRTYIDPIFNTGGQYKIVDITSPCCNDGSFLLGRDDSNNRPSLEDISDNGNLYAVEYNSNMGSLTVHRRNLTTGELDGVIALINVGNTTTYFNPIYFNIDDGIVYFVRSRRSDVMIEIGSYDLTTNQSMILFSSILFPEPRASYDPGYVSGFDVDDGKAVLYSSYNGNFVLVDLSTGSMDMFNLGGMWSMQLLSQAEYPQLNQESLQTSGGIISMSLPEGTAISQLSTQPNPQVGTTPAGLTFPVGFQNKILTGMQEGGALMATFELPAGVSVNNYYKFGPTPDDPSEHWYEFSYDGRTGAEINGSTITLHFVDGERGDDDLQANGLISGTGAPVFSSSSGDSGGSDAPGSGATGSGGGGCTVASRSPFDPLMFLMIGMSLFYLVRKRFKQDKKMKPGAKAVYVGSDRS